MLAPRLVSTAFNGVVKGAFDGLKPDSCELVPLPPPSLVAKFTGSEGFAAADATKLKAFDDKWGPTLRALPRTQDGAKICLPSAENLDKLAFAQAKLARAFGGEEAKAFGTYFGGVSKASIVPGKVLPYLLWLYLLWLYLLCLYLVWPPSCRARYCRYLLLTTPTHYSTLTLLISDCIQGAAAHRRRAEADDGRIAQGAATLQGGGEGSRDDLEDLRRAAEEGAV